MYYEVIPKRLFRADGNFLTYSSAENLTPGNLVEIPLGKSKTVGLVYKKLTQAPEFETKPISKVLYTEPLPPHLLKALDFLHDYYLIPYPTALNLILPVGVEKSRRAAPLQKNPNKPEQNSSKITQKPNNSAENSLKPLKTPEIPLNPAQKQALERIKTAPEATKLLFGITGSGKTNIYLKMAENALKAQKSAIILVPEIALTAQLVRVFEQQFPEKTVLLHSKQTESERHLLWQKILFAKEPLVIVGPRSALFAPVKDLGLIVIDECHESSFFQENSPRYSALRLASAVAKSEKITCLLGSATPNLTDYYIADRKKSLIPLKTPAKSTAKTPDIKIIDLKDRSSFQKNRHFSDALLKNISENLENRHQTLIFHNRRGSSPLSLCENCGYEFVCPHCFLPLTLHADSYSLICHTCDYSIPVPPSCPSCGSPSILFKGFGTKLLETELKKLFKTAKIARFDADNKKSETLAARYDELKSGKIDIIIGTQTVAKGLDLPNLATVAVVQADSGLSLPDFSAEERTFELLTQVIGRVGRGHLDSASVFIQTFRPDHPVINFAIHADYENFAKYCLTHRHSSHFPPYAFLATVSLTMKTESLVIKKISTLANSLKFDKTLLVSPPEPAFHERTSRGYTWRLLLRSRSRAHLLEVLKNLPPAFKITLDPPSLL